MRKHVMRLLVSKKQNLGEIELELTVELEMKSTFEGPSDAFKSMNKEMELENFIHALEMISPKFSEYKRIPLTQTPLGE